MDNFTVKQLQEKLDVTYPEAFGLINVLLKIKAIKKLPPPPRNKDQKGKTAGLYALEENFGATLETFVKEAFNK